MIERENTQRNINGTRSTLTRFFNSKGQFLNELSSYEPLVELTVSKQRSGEDLPGFSSGFYRYRFRPPTVYLYNRTSRQAWTGIVHLKQKGDGGSFIQVAGVLTSSSGVTPPELSALKSALNAQVTIKLLNSVKDQKINLAQAFAERAQTIQLLASTAIKLAKSFSALRRGNIVAAGKALGIRVSRRTRQNYRIMRQEKPFDAASNAWLELQYGWKPLLNDVYGAAEQAAILNGEKVVGRASVSHRRKYNDVVRIQIPGLQGDAMASVQRQVDLEQKMTVYFEVNNSSLKTAAQMGLTNPLVIAWELTPWSFVVDWFIPVGNWLSSLDATTGTVFKSGTSTVVENHRYEGTLTGFAPDSGNYWASRSGAGSYSFEQFALSRTLMGSYPSSKLPEFKNPLSTVHALNAIALLRGLFSKHAQQRESEIRRLESIQRNAGRQQLESRRIALRNRGII